ncbi:glycosyltransferase [Crocosphaera sp.]|uniref:glycosyltransferase family 32 protein n=1 Tax=Crocosphaera sp. TaxID=2729996 RepID=UPI002616BB81|nr:glycosyltransferase [Crocosphaera sp.]MDJ0581303.1 glycosyltransferase [Crocosphaera sp.]
MNQTSTIPKIIHQTWKTPDIPSEFYSLQQTWKEHHPDWEYRFWTDEDNRNLIAEHYSWFLPIYDNYDRGIKKANAVRHFIMYHYGGLYVDLDFECLQNFDQLLADKQLVFGLEPPDHLETPGSLSRGFDKLVCDALIASQPLHPFWKHLFDYLLKYQESPDVLDAVSVYLVTRAYNSYPHPETMTILPSNYFYPLTIKASRQDYLKNKDFRQQISPETYAIHHWSGLWRKEFTLELVKQKLRQRRNS